MKQIPLIAVTPKWLYRTEDGLATIKRSTGGWGGTWSSNCTRNWAVKVDGRFLRTKAGAIRTFSTAQAAARAYIASTVTVATPVCTCMPEDETGRIAVPSGSCPEHGYLVDEKE